MKLSHASRFALASIALLAVLLAACSATGDTPAPATSPADAVATAVSATLAAATQPAPIAPSDSAPQASAQPAASTARAVLVSAGAPQPQVDALAAVLEALAAQDGLALEAKADLAPGDLDDGARVVVFAAPPPNLDQLLQAGAGAQFVVISSADVPQQADNLSVIRSSMADEAFLGGYIASLLSERIAPVGLIASDAPDFETLQDAYLTGGRFFCGACRLLPNFENISPVVVSLPAASDAASWNAAIAPAAKFGLDVVYLPAESATPEVIALLASSAQRVVGNFAPPPELAGKWVASVRADAAESLRALWPDLLAGQGGKRLSARVEVTEIAARWLTPGRQRLVTDLRERLETGEVTPLEEK